MFKKIIIRFFLYCFLTSFVYILYCKWFYPPITITQLSHAFTLGIHRTYINEDRIPYDIKLAAIASEDQDFAEHHGFDWKSLRTSFTTSKKKHRKLSLGSGASTISQQTAKNVFLWQGEGITRYIRKGLEFYFTAMIELIWGKKRILEVYLNVIEMGQGIYGVEAASEHYFHYPASQLTRKQSAMIIACLPNPRRFSVVPPSARVLWRYPQILQQMNNIEDDDDIQAIIRR